jgi:hypothetical protein
MNGVEEVSWIFLEADVRIPGHSCTAAGDGADDWVGRAPNFGKFYRSIYQWIQDDKRCKKGGAKLQGGLELARFRGLTSGWQSHEG